MNTVTSSPVLRSSDWSRATAGLLTRDHRLSAPLDRSGQGDRLPDGSPAITVYALEVALNR